MRLPLTEHLLRCSSRRGEGALLRLFPPSICWCFTYFWKKKKKDILHGRYRKRGHRSFNWLLLFIRFCDLYLDVSAVPNYKLKFHSLSFSHTWLVETCAVAVTIGQLVTRAETGFENGERGGRRPQTLKTPTEWIEVCSSLLRIQCFNFNLTIWTIVRITTLLLLFYVI